MSSAAAIAETTGLPDWERELLNRQLARLERLADSAERVVAEFEARIVAPDPGLSIAERRHAGLDYDRASRALRMTLALQSKLVRDARAPAAANDDEDEDEVPPGYYQVIWPRSATEQEAQAVGATVRAAAQAAHLDPGHIERLAAEAAERLDRDDIHALLATRPFDSVVAHICEELGLTLETITRPPPLAGEGGEPCNRQTAIMRTPAEERAGEVVERAYRAAAANQHDPPCAQPP